MKRLLYFCIASPSGVSLQTAYFHRGDYELVSHPKERVLRPKGRHPYSNYMH